MMGELVVDKIKKKSDGNREQLFCFYPAPPVSLYSVSP
jgi:hypothetical protein